MQLMRALRYLTANIYTKWILIVSLNAVLGFILGYEDGGYVHLIGMISGVVTWFLAYLFLDKYLQKTGRKNMSRKLSLSAALRIPLQLLAIPDVYAGMAAIWTIEMLGLGGVGVGGGFIESYCATVFTGLYLSFICSFIYLGISGVEAVKGLRANASKKAN